MASSGGGEPGTGGDEGGGEATLLVSEFPPPPFYFRRALSLTPPAIPTEALERGSKRAAAAAAKAHAESERMRLLGEDAASHNTDAILGGVLTKEEEDGDVVAVFGEIVEDPLLVQVKDNCEDPTLVRDEVSRLNKKVVQGFVKLVQDLVHRPLDNKKCRDELSHNVFLMLQECNKFREHQARELIIKLLEKQLLERQEALKDLQSQISHTHELLRVSNLDVDS